MGDRPQHYRVPEPVRRLLRAFGDVFALNPREQLVIAILASLLLLGLCIRLFISLA